MSNTPQITIPTSFDVRALAETIVQLESDMTTSTNPLFQRVMAARLAGLEEAWCLLTGDHGAVNAALHAGNTDEADAIMDRVESQREALLKTRPTYVATAG